MMKKFTILFLLIFGASNLTQAQWGNDVRLTNNSAASLLSKNECLVVSNDTLHVTWVDTRDGNSEVYYKCSINGGISWGIDTRLTYNDSLADRPVIALSGSNLHVVWTSCRDGNNEIYYKHSTDGGTIWGADVRLTNYLGNSSFADISVLDSVIHVVWYDNRDGTASIYYKRSTDGGVSWGSEVAIKSGSGGANSASIAISGSDVYVTWADYRDGNLEIYYKHSTNAGDIWGSATRLTYNPANSQLPRMVISASIVHVAWYDARDGNYEIYYKRSTDGGLTWGVDTRLTNASGNSKTITMLVSGSLVHIAWQDDRNGNYEIFYMCSMDGGLSWSSDTLLVNNNVTMSERPSIALSGDAVHLIWQDKRDGPNGEIYYKRNPTGNFIGIEDRDITKNYLAIYPNPFSEYTNIEFEMASPGNVEIIIFNQLGNHIQTLKYNNCKAGRNSLQWNCSDKNGIAVPSGIYYCEVIFGKEMLVKKMIVVK